MAKKADTRGERVLYTSLDSLLRVQVMRLGKCQGGVK
jgi:hypothetical protein